MSDSTSPNAPPVLSAVAFSTMRFWRNQTADPSPGASAIIPRVASSCGPVRDSRAGLSSSIATPSGMGPPDATGLALFALLCNICIEM
jgi:hypothetical protein